MTLPRVRTPFDDRLHPFEAWWRSWSSVEEVPDHLILRARAAYWALIDRMDALIGDILEALRRNGLEDDTLIVYHSDHGDMAGEHDLWMKRCHYEASARIPAIVSWPGVLPEGVACDRVVSALDLNATMLDALGADPLPGSHGRSLLDLIGGRQTAWDDLAYCEYCVYEGWTTRMIRRGDWKFIYYHGHRPQLFNLREDPDELADRSGDPACAAIVKELTAAVLADWDPDAVERKMDERRRATDLIAAWSRETGAPEQFVWPRLPGMDYVEPG